MRTNGGCYCLKDLDFDKRMRTQGYIRHLESEVERLRAALEAVVGDPHSYECGHGVRLTETCDEPDCPLACVRAAWAEAKRKAVL
jgi:hypothetical protein